MGQDDYKFLKAIKKNIIKVFIKPALKAFTLIEILVTIIILIIIVTFALPNFRRAYLATQDKEAVSMLKLIQQAERIYFLENNIYLNCTNNTNCNTGLRLAVTSKNWNFTVTNASNSTHCAAAKSSLTQGSGTGNWTLANSQSEPVQGSSCP